MQRKVISLSKDTVLWEAGDVARTIAVVAKGKLGARTTDGLMGIALPNMVLGESSLFADESRDERRTATIFALEDDTVVTEYPAASLRNTLASGDDELLRQIMSNMVGQICRNLLMVVSARRGHPFIEEPLTAMARAILQDAQEKAPIRSWDGLMLTCRFLHDMRDLSDRLLAQLGPDVSERAEMIVNASQMLGQLFEGGLATDVRPLLEIFLNAEREKHEWWARGEAHP